MTEHQPARNDGEHDLEIEKRRQRGRGCAGIGHDQQQVPDRAEHAQQHQQAPDMHALGHLPGPGQQQGRRHHAHAAGVELRGRRVVLLGKPARQHLEQGVVQHEHQRQHGCPVEQVPRRPDHDQRAHHAAQHQQPLQPRHPLAQAPDSQQRDAQRGEGHHGSEFGDRQHLQAVEGQDRGRDQQESTQHLQARSAAVVQRAAARRCGRRDGEQHLEQVAEPHHHHHRHGRGQHLGARVEGDETDQCRQRAGDRGGLAGRHQRGQVRIPRCRFRSASRRCSGRHARCRGGPGCPAAAVAPGSA